MSPMSLLNGLGGIASATPPGPSSSLLNNSNGDWIVQKFGGTSVGKLPVNIAEDIVREYLAHNKIAVVCSARSTGKKVEGTTSRLLEVYNVLAQISHEGDSESVRYDSLVREYERLIAVILEDHISAANEYIQDADVRAALIRDMNKECSDLLEFRQAQEKFKLAIDSRSKDRVVSYGEKLSCRFMAALLRDRGVDSEYVDLSDVIHFRTSGRIDAAFYADLAEVLKQKVLACQGRVPVITGYFGAVPGGLMDGEVGRGYTDLCAALVAVGLKADELQVWKEVDGIFTADPNKVPTARLLSTITPAEAAELTFYGSEVIHHLTMDQVIHATPPIKIRIKNVKNPQGRGTIVLPDPVLSGQEIKRTRSSTLTNGASQRRTPKRPTAVTIKNDISVINVHSNKRSISHGFFAKVFSILDRLQISVDLISTSEVHVSMAVHAATQEDLDNAKKALEDCGEVSIIRKLSILSLVGAEMKSAIGIAGKMFSVLGKNNINLEMISQGASEINISCVIEAFEATRAMSILHTELFNFLE